MNHLTSLNIYCKSRRFHEINFQETQKVLPTKEVFSIFLQNTYLFDKENCFSMPFEIKKRVLELVIDLKFQALNEKILDISADIYRRLMSSHGMAFDLNKADVLNDRTRIFPCVEVRPRTSLCFRLEMNLFKSATSYNSLFPFQTRMAMSYVEKIMTEALKTKQMIFILQAKLPFSEMAKGIPLPIY